MKTSETERIISLTDGVFAIVMTLLVLELSIPVIAGASKGVELGQRLLGMWPKYVSYVVSFLMLSLFWGYHNTIFTYVKRSDSRLFWLSLLFLMFVALIPFSASLVATYWEQQITAVLYGLSLMFPFLAGLSLSLYALRGNRLVDDDIDPALIKREEMSGLIVAICFIVAIGASFVRPIISFAIYALMPLFYIVSSLLGAEGLSLRKPVQGAGS